MEFVKSCLIDWLLFSGIEGFIFCLFFEKIGGCKKFKWWQCIILSIGNCIITTKLPPILFQLIMIMWMTFLLKVIDKKNKIIYYIKQCSLSILCFCIIEVLYSILIENFFNFNSLIDGMSISKKIYLFFIMILIRVIEILLIFSFNKFNKKKV